jgi:hypothetical protein
VASERESGLEKAERSSSSPHGRRSDSERRAESESRLRKSRKAGVAIGASDAPAAAGDESAGAGLVTGRRGGGVGAEAMAMGSFAIACAAGREEWEKARRCVPDAVLLGDVGSLTRGPGPTCQRLTGGSWCPSVGSPLQMVVAFLLPRLVVNDLFGISCLSMTVGRM